LHARTQSHVTVACLIAGDSEVQRTMLELLNQLDGFEPKQNIKVCHSPLHYWQNACGNLGYLGQF